MTIRKRIFDGVSVLLGPTEQDKIPLGSSVFCPGCGTALYHVIHEVSIHSIRFSHNFISITEYPVPKFPFICPLCSRLILNSFGRFTYVKPKEFM